MPPSYSGAGPTAWGLVRCVGVNQIRPGPHVSDSDSVQRPPTVSILLFLVLHLTTSGCQRELQLKRVGMATSRAPSQLQDSAMLQVFKCRCCLF